MVDYNEFKRSVKRWLHDNPSGSTVELRDYCEEIIPPSHFAANQWLIDQTVSWYRHILSHRELREDMEDDCIE